MDALAQGYGSDSSASSQDAPSSNNKSTTIGLLANYSDDSDDDGADAETPPQHEDTTNLVNNEKGIGSSTNESSTSTSQATKKRKLSETIATTCSLPSPRLKSSASDNNTSLLFSKNYLQNKLHYKTTNNDPALISKLNQLHENKISFAQQLKSQKEFGNPHMFGSVIECFGIDPMESNLGAGFEGFEYIDRLLVKEEENRVRLGS